MVRINLGPYRRSLMKTPDRNPGEIPNEARQKLTCSLKIASTEKRARKALRVIKKNRRGCRKEVRYYRCPV